MPVIPPGGTEQPILGSLDPASRQVVCRLVILLALVILWAFTLSSEHPILAPSTMTFLTAGIQVFHACLRQERFSVPSLNHWDTATAFMGLSCVA